MCTCIHIDVRGQFAGIGSLHLQCGPWGLNSGHLVWQQALFHILLTLKLFKGLFYILFIVVSDFFWHVFVFIYFLACFLNLFCPFHISICEAAVMCLFLPAALIYIQILFMLISWPVSLLWHVISLLSVSPAVRCIANPRISTRQKFSWLSSGKCLDSSTLFWGHPRNLPVPGRLCGSTHFSKTLLIQP